LAKKYWLDFSTKLIQSEGEYDKKPLRVFKEELESDKISVNEVISKLMTICNNIGLEVDTSILNNKFKTYCRLIHERNNTKKKEKEEIEAALKRLDNSIKNSVYFVDNNILPYMTAVTLNIKAID